jgi:hypothetical protein
MDPNETGKENMQDSSGNVRLQQNINLTEKGQEHFEKIKEPY